MTAKVIASISFDTDINLLIYEHDYLSDNRFPNDR